jgi:hypothetical protein
MATESKSSPIDSMADKKFLRASLRRCHRRYHHGHSDKPDLGRQDASPALSLNGVPTTAAAAAPKSGSFLGRNVVFSTIKQITREKGVRWFYKGLSASYFGVTEGTIQWVLYERLKRMMANAEGTGGLQEWASILGSAGTAKCVASLISYPHEVRKPPRST